MVGQDTFLKLFAINLIFSSVLITNSSEFNCNLPEGCRFEKIYSRSNLIFNERSASKLNAIVCDVENQRFKFKFEGPNLTKHHCDMSNDEDHTQMTLLRWTSSESITLNNRFNFTNALTYFSYFKKQMDLQIHGLKGFDLNFFVEKYRSKSPFLGTIELVDTRMDFYHDNKKISSCREMVDLNLTNIKSIFQLTTMRYKNQLILRGVEYKSKICPLVFQNSNITLFLLFDLVDSFYKTNVLTFSSDYNFSSLNSKIAYIDLSNAQNIVLDFNIFNPSVFDETTHLIIYSGSLNSINEKFFQVLKKIRIIIINPTIIRKINHKQGLQWIRNINSDVNVDFDNLKVNHIYNYKLLYITSDKNIRKRISKLFPDEDFCLYVDFPFNQFVIFYDNITERYKNKSELLVIDYEYSCTYLWLIQYYEHYYNYLSYHKQNEYHLGNILTLINSTAFKSISKCGFEARKSLCNKSNYQRREICDEGDIFILNKKLQTAFKISLYPVSFICLLTNLIVVVVIRKKENNDLFKEFKQYSYLCLNSVFCIMISVIELLSWMTECFYPFEVFCPEIRKLVAIQFFKIIFKECLINLLRFMCNFTYIAFAFNRISLIGRDHEKLVTFMSEVGLKKYIAVTFLISSSLSWIKGFKYEVNYFYPSSSFPLSNEMNILSPDTISFNDFYFIYNSISDLVNYVVFVVLIVIIDIFMVVKLRKTLKEREAKSKSMNQKQDQTKKTENEEVVNKAIKMVVLNSTIGILFKLPVSLVPLINVVAQFYYKNLNNLFVYPGFHEFYLTLYITGLNILLQDLSGFLYTLSLSIQMCIYKRFDKKFQAGFDRL